MLCVGLCWFARASLAVPQVCSVDEGRRRLGHEKQGHDTTQMQLCVVSREKECSSAACHRMSPYDTTPSFFSVLEGRVYGHGGISVGEVANGC